MRRFIRLAAALMFCGIFCLITAGCSGPRTEVVIETSMGTINVELFDNEAPLTVKNFLNYVDAKHYDGTVFHRVIRDFMIQGGGYTPELKRLPFNLPVRNEAFNGLKNKVGTLAMARTDDPNSAADEFFINAKDNPQLDRSAAGHSEGYCVFGHVTTGMDVVDKIQVVKTSPNDTPLEAVIIKSIRRVKKEKD